jgi:hypothetical protein
MPECQDSAMIYAPAKKVPSLSGTGCPKTKTYNVDLDGTRHRSLVAHHRALRRRFAETASREA